MACCIAPQVEAADTEMPNCHAMPEAASVDHGDTNSGEAPPVGNCCEMAGKDDARLDKSVDFDVQPTIVLAAAVVLAPTPPRHSAAVHMRVPTRDNGPPIYLSIASFLI